MNHPNATVGHFAYERLRVQFDAIVELGDRLRGEVEVEDVHRIRVAIRRFRAILKLFEDDLPRRIVDLDARYRRAGAQMGAVRDLDVQLALLGGEFPEIADQLRERRAKALSKMRRYLHSFGYRQLLLTTKTLLAREPTDSRPLAEVVPDLLRKRHRNFVRKARPLKEDDKPERFHAARVSGKQLRYAVEVLSDVYEEAAPYAKRLAKLQDILGEHQDCYVACEMYDSWEPKLAKRFASRAKRLRSIFPDAFDKAESDEWKALKKAL